jgi:hypothetical protein
MTGATDFYNDHFTIDHPIRNLADPVPEQTDLEP